MSDVVVSRHVFLVLVRLLALLENRLLLDLREGDTGACLGVDCLRAVVHGVEDLLLGHRLVRQVRSDVPFRLF